MPRFVPSVLIADCWGSVGDLTFYHVGGQCFYKKKAAGEFPGTTGQLDQLGVHRRALAAWRTLPQETQEVWNSLASPVISHILAGIVGLIPNCAPSVIITELYLDQMITLGTMMSGLLVGAGIGLLVLFRVNSNKKENINVAFILFIIGTVTGLLIDMLGISL